MPPLTPGSGATASVALWGKQEAPYPPVDPPARCISPVMRHRTAAGEENLESLRCVLALLCLCSTRLFRLEAHEARLPPGSA